MRARYPDTEGYVERDGVKVFYEAFGDGEPTLLMLPTWTFAPSRVWKAQVPYLARHFRVVTIDPRGNGRSDRPVGVAAYAEREFAADALAVMEATDTERAVLVSLSLGAQRTLLLAAEHPERVLGAAFIGPFFPASFAPGSIRWRLMAHPRLRRLDGRPAAHDARLVQVQRPALAARLRRFRELVGSHVPSGGPLDQADGGPHRLGAGHRLPHAVDLRQLLARGTAHPGWTARAGPPAVLSGARDVRHR